MDQTRDEIARLLGISLGKLWQEVQQSEAAGGDLLGAVVRVVLHGPIQTGRIDGREARQFQG